jgi:hypothetical protein
LQDAWAWPPDIAFGSGPWAHRRHLQETSSQRFCPVLAGALGACPKRPESVRRV